MYLFPVSKRRPSPFIICLTERGLAGTHTKKNPQKTASQLECLDFNEYFFVLFSFLALILTIFPEATEDNFLNYYFSLLAASNLTAR